LQTSPINTPKTNKGCQLGLYNHRVIRNDASYLNIDREEIEELDLEHDAAISIVVVRPPNFEGAGEE
jgi:hypothetical protein